VRVVVKFVVETHGSNGDLAHMCVSFSDDGHALVSICPEAKYTRFVSLHLIGIQMFNLG